MSNAGHVSGKVAVVTGGAHVWAPHTFVPGARRCDRRCDRHNRRPRSLPGRAVAVGGKRRLLLPPRCHQPRRVGSRGGERPAGARPDRRARQQRRRAGQIDGNRSRRSRMGPVGTRRAYTNPCLGSGRKAAGAMLEYARYSRSSTSFSSMSESRSLLRISRSRPPDRVSSTAIRRQIHAPGTRMVRDEPYSLGNGDGNIRMQRVSGCGQHIESDYRRPERTGYWYVTLCLLSDGAASSIVSH
jgi:hypothetical protein